MAAHVVVIATDLRRTTVKVTPGTYLTDVLQQACAKFNLPSDGYMLKHKQKTVNLSYPFRTSGLVGGAKLELVQKANTPSVVQVALQIPLPEGKEIPGGRLISKFPSDITLWALLRQFESGNASAGRNINITARGVAETSSSSGTGGGQLYYEIPVLNLMGREMSSLSDFQKTLSQLGYNSGSVLIRLTFRRTEQTLYDAMKEIGQYFQQEAKESKEAEDSQNATKDSSPATKEIVTDETEDVPAKTETTATEPARSTSEPISALEIKEAQPPAEISPPEDMDIDPSTASDPLQPRNVFLAPTSETPVAASLPRNDSDYTPTVAHAQLHQTRLQESSRNRRLLSDKELQEKAAAEEAKLAAVKSVLVKVRFPDNTSSDWQIGPSETGAFLHQAVRHVMATPEQPFKLVLPGSKVIVKDDASPKHKLIREYKLAGRVLINLVWDDSVPPEVRARPFLKDSVSRQAQLVKVQDVPEVPDEEEPVAAPVKKAEKEDRGDGGGGKKTPKWLKLGKK